MDDNNMLNDENLDNLGYIKEFDMFSLVDTQFNKKRERKRIKRVVFISTLMIVFVSLITCLAIIMPKIVVVDKKVIDISLECGFPNEMAFINKFKLKYNMTPNAYRKNKSK